MSDKGVPEFAQYIKGQRESRRLSMRELALKTGLNNGTLCRLEQGKVTPTPATLKALATGLDVPLSDMFAMAGYVTPSDLPSLSYYLHTKYNYLSQSTCDKIEDDVRHKIDQHEIDKSKPIDWDNETF